MFVGVYLYTCVYTLCFDCLEEHFGCRNRNVRAKYVVPKKYNKNKVPRFIYTPYEFCKGTVEDGF